MWIHAKIPDIVMIDKTSDYCQSVDVEMRVGAKARKFKAKVIRILGENLKCVRRKLILAVTLS